MKLWRSRWCRAAVLPTLVGATAVAGPAARADIGAEVPRIIDVSTLPGERCDSPLRGTTSVFFPPGGPAGTEVEWRILAGQQPLRSGIAPVNAEVMTVGFDIAQDELPPDGLLRMDARARMPGGAVGEYGKPWNFRVSRECRPLHVVSVGDSVMWGQGLDLERKFAHLTAEALGVQTGRGAELHDYSRSGAVLDAPELPAGNDDRLCQAESGAAAIAGGFTESGMDRLPDVFCQLEQAAAAARNQGYTVDLVLLDGCINDLDPFFGIPVGVTPGTQDLTAAIHRECGGAGAEPVNPAADVPYFSSAATGYGGRGMQEAIELAHALPGRPKVLVANYFHGYDTESVPDVLRQRWSEFVRVSAEVFRTAAKQANAVAGENFAVSADGLYARPAGRSGDDRRPAMNPLGDEGISLRLLACPQLGELPPQCLGAVGPPDPEGARQYAEAFLLNPRIREWFGGGGPAGEGFTVDGTPGADGVTVDFDATPAGGAIRQYEWYFGDGTHLVTTEPVVSHHYTDSGPYLPRLVVTDMTGNRSLYEHGKALVID
ncbi:PKD domain-containing protein [Nocardia sp. NPDC127526]|uniref:PKD domain-containing protein n=1 Tax=Nocardia sp. NPDC127526 TaxID=3345393 RepID=UPI003638460F